MSGDRPASDKPGFGEKKGSGAHGSQHGALTMSCTKPAREGRGSFGRYRLLQRWRQDQHIAGTWPFLDRIESAVEDDNRIRFILNPEMAYTQARGRVLQSLGILLGDFEQVGQAQGR